MTTSVILVLLFSGHALFAVSDVPADRAGHKSAADAILPDHLQLRERSARGLTETGRPHNLLDLFKQQFVIYCHYQVQQMGFNLRSVSGFCLQTLHRRVIWLQRQMLQSP